MKIPNYDKINNNRKSNSNRKLNDFLDGDFRMLIRGQSNCGKTNTLMHMLRTPLMYYDKIYMYTPNHHQEKIQDLKKLMDKISKQVGYDVLEIKWADDIKDTSEYPNNNRKVVFFDDLINASERIQNKISNHFTDGRHHQISPIYLSQSYYDVPQKLRHNCSHMVLYPPTTKNHLNLIAKENLFNPELFNELEPYEFLFVNKENKTCKKNFDEILYNHII